MPITIIVQIPALDRLLDFLESKNQTQIDSITQQLIAQTDLLKQGSDLLQRIVKENTK